MPIKKPSTKVVKFVPKEMRIDPSNKKMDMWEKIDRIIRYGVGAYDGQGHNKQNSVYTSPGLNDYARRIMANFPEKFYDGFSAYFRTAAAVGFVIIEKFFEDNNLMNKETRECFEMVDKMNFLGEIKRKAEISKRFEEALTEGQKSADPEVQRETNELVKMMESYFKNDKTKKKS